MANDGYVQLAQMFKQRDNPDTKGIELADITIDNPLTIKLKSNGGVYFGDRLILPQSLAEKEYTMAIKKTDDANLKDNMIGNIDLISGSENNYTIKNINTSEDMLIVTLKNKFEIGDEVIVAPVGKSYMIIDKVYRG